MHTQSVTASLPAGEVVLAGHSEQLSPLAASPVKPGAHSHAASDVLPGPDTACEGHAAHSPEASPESLYVSASHGAHTGGSCAPVFHTALKPDLVTEPSDMKRTRRYDVSA
jgi:hypothetical protein